MTQDKFDEVLNSQIERCIKVLNSKQKEYVLNKSDRLKAFKIVWLDNNKNNQKQVLWGQMVKHLSSIYDMCQKDKKYDLDNIDKWYEKITDTINYLIILIAIIEDEK